MKTTRTKTPAPPEESFRLPLLMEGVWTYARQPHYRHCARLMIRCSLRFTDRQRTRLLNRIVWGTIAGLFVGETIAVVYYFCQLYP